MTTTSGNDPPMKLRPMTAAEQRDLDLWLAARRRRREMRRNVITGGGQRVASVRRPRLRVIDGGQRAGS